MKKLVAAHGPGIQRCFVRANGRGVHYVRAGDGPPVVLLHMGNSSARGLVPFVQRLMRDHTVFAFDHPGYGDSDAIPKRNLRLADVADALSVTLKALKLPPCPVYGSHSGADVAMELGRRHPEHVAALILDGVTIFSPRETKYFIGDEYLSPYVVQGDGSHLFKTWVKIRDGLTWFPWSQPTGSNRRPYAFPPLEGLHQRLVDRLRAGDGYRDVYGAAFKYDVVSTARALTLPATYMASVDDPLFPHLDRLPKLKANQRIRRFGKNSVFSARYIERVARVVRGYRVKAKASSEAPFSPTPGALNRRYVDLNGGQVLVRSAGEAVNGRPLMLLHDGRSSSSEFERPMRELARRRPVYAPDLPDNGASDPFSAPQPRISDYADAVAEIVAKLKISTCDFYAVGAGAVVALDLLRRAEFSKASAVLEAPDFYAPPFARRLAQSWGPPLSPQWDGAHLNHVWLMLRDEYSFWPWFDKSPAAACAVDAPQDWNELNERATGVLRSLATYHRLTAAAMRFDWRRALRRARKRAILATIPADPRRPHAETAARLAHLPSVASLPATAEAKARHILRLHAALNTREDA